MASASAAAAAASLPQKNPEEYWDQFQRLWLDFETAWGCVERGKKEREKKERNDLFAKKLIHLAGSQLGSASCKKKTEWSRRLGSIVVCSYAADRRNPHCVTMHNNVPLRSIQTRSPNYIIIIITRAVATSNIYIQKIRQFVLKRRIKSGVRILSAQVSFDSWVIISSIWNWPLSSKAKCDGSWQSWNRQEGRQTTYPQFVVPICYSASFFLFQLSFGSESKVVYYQV